MAPRQPLAGLILAAGKGTRMKSELPKCLHEVCGLPMVEHVVRAMRGAGVERPVVVVGHGAELVEKALGSGCDYALQAEQQGTGHAVMAARGLLGGHEGPLLVAAGDTPLLSAETLAGLVEAQKSTGAAATLATFTLEDPFGYGRIVRKNGKVAAIVEQKDCDDDEAAIDEVNAAVYCFDGGTLFSELPRLQNENAQREYYLTDIVARLVGEGLGVEAVVFDDESEFLGVNDRWQLAEASFLMRLSILGEVAANGVTVVDPGSTHVGADVEIGPDTTILPGCVIEGKTKIGSRCQIGPSCWIKDSVIGDSCRVFMSHMDQATMEAGSRCGPFSNLRPGARLGSQVKIGNFVEVKNADLAQGVSVSHLTYIGDANVGEGSNVGAGTITCNYDGFTKSRTEIGKGVFVGSNSTLVAPVKIGDGAFVAAGSVVTKDVPEDALAVGRSRQENKEQWAKSWRKRKTDQQ
ncbi:MAG: bifunctional UDP-N-acetylglucosamine diphosphorylase/glucosamine-1-phosphate N-acetyltransferase GlmU [Fimbriimonadaceae bacterium]